ncbi:hypothetical protein [Marivita sp.]
MIRHRTIAHPFASQALTARGSENPALVSQNGWGVLLGCGGKKYWLKT